MAHHKGIPVEGNALVESVYKFNELGQITPPGHFNADRVGFYTGMQLEEMSETIVAIAAGAVTADERESLSIFSGILAVGGREFKAGKHHGSVLRADREELLDGGIDVAVVTLGSIMYQTPKFREAIAAVLFANADKADENGVFHHDDNGKIMKPSGWKKPDITPFVDRPID